jgi:DNA-binding transcriptional MocR family regulator
VNEFVLDGEAPLHAQIRRAVAGAILSGKISPGGRVPPEADLMRQFGASRMTVHRAISDLAGEGLVRRNRRAGIFRARLMDYWQGRCPLTGISEPGPLRAFHIKPWASCATFSRAKGVPSAAMPPLSRERCGSAVSRICRRSLAISHRPSGSRVMRPERSALCMVVSLTPRRRAASRVEGVSSAMAATSRRASVRVQKRQ